MTATKNEVIKHINKLFENQVHTPDAAVEKTNPVPEIEKIFKETIGKNLIYF